MNATEIAIYAIETRTIIQILWGLLLVLSITVVSVSIMYVLLRLKLRSYRRRESQAARHIATKSDEITRLELLIAHYIEIEEGAEELKAEVRRLDAVRDETEQRLAEQGSELETQRARVAELESQAVDAKTEVRRVEAIRQKTEERLKAQNDELESLRDQVGRQGDELARLRKLVEHVIDL